MAARAKIARSSQPVAKPKIKVTTAKISFTANTGSALAGG
jgi:hypothetical protein